MKGGMRYKGNMEIMPYSVTSVTMYESMVAIMNIGRRCDELITPRLRNLKEMYNGIRAPPMLIARITFPLSVAMGMYMKLNMRERK